MAGWKYPLAWLMTPVAFILLLWCVLVVSISHPDPQTRRYWTKMGRVQWRRYVTILAGTLPGKLP